MKERIDWQPVNGILLVNKPQGLSSNALLQQVRRLYRAKKAGHTGSLDPLATGMLPICFGEATKFCQYLLAADKCYEATACLGIKTDTSDSLGQITQVIDNFYLTRSDLLAAIKQFTGQIKQIPSMYSALKHQGVPLYKYAREGITIERQAREIVISELELNQFDGKVFTVKVHCSKGTYIRNLIEDIGDKLGVGAHVTQLHRLFTAGFTNEVMHTLEELKHKSPAELFACLLPMERAVDYLPSITLSNENITYLRQGKMLRTIGDNEEKQGRIRLYNEKLQFIGIGEISPEDTLSAKRLLTEGAIE